MKNQVHVPDSPAGGQARWLLQRLGAEAAFNPQEMAEHHTAEVLNSAPSLTSELSGLGQFLSPFEIVAAEPMGPLEVRVRLRRLADSELWDLGCFVSDRSPHLISGYAFAPAALPPSGAVPMRWEDLSEQKFERHLSGLSEAKVERVEILTRLMRDEERVPSIAIALISDGVTCFVATIGDADVYEGRALTPQTVAPALSITKVFTAVAVMQLAERGQVSLDDPVNDHLKGLRVEHPDPSSPPVTLRSLLTHTSGLEIPGGVPVDPEAPDKTLRETLGPVLHTQSPVGTRLVYSNHGFDVLGLMIEDVTGQHHEAYVRDNVMRILEMDESGFLDGFTIPDIALRGYEWSFGELAVSSVVPMLDSPAGGVAASIKDLATFAEALLMGGKLGERRILGEATLKQMFTPQPIPLESGSSSTVQGICFPLEQVQGHRVAWHNGGMPGYKSSMWLAPEHGAGVILLTNLKANKLDDLALDVLKVLVS